MNDDRLTRMAPDPVTAVLCALSALAAVTSIAAINWVAQERGIRRERPRRRASRALRDLERDCCELGDALSRLERNLLLFGGAGGSAATPIKFGVHALHLPEGSFALQQALVGEIADLYKRSSAHSFEVMCLIEDGLLDPPDDVFFALGEMQDRLNSLLIDRRSMRATVTEAGAVADELAGVVRQLRAFQTA